MYLQATRAKFFQDLTIDKIHVYKNVILHYMHFKGIKSVVSLSKSKKEAKYIKNENIIIQTSIHTQHICLSYFAI